MFTIISRIFHFGLKNFSRNGWLSTTTIAIMTLALTVFGGLILFGYFTQQAAASIESKINISVYFTTNTPEDEILNIQQSLEGLSQVASVDYISRDQALTIFEQKHANDPDYSQAINQLSANPLEASLIIQAKDPNQYGSIADYLGSPNLSQYVHHVSYTESPESINKLARIVTTVEQSGWAITIFLVIVAGLVVFNTIRLAIYSSRDEISVMRVVGASNSLVRGPFVIDGMLCGAIAAVASLAIIAPILYFVSPYLDFFVPNLNLFHYFYTHILRLLAYELTFGVVIGAFSSFFAVRRYLTH